MKVNHYVQEYIDLWRTGKIELNKERKQLIKRLERDYFTRDDIYFNDKQIQSCVDFIEKWYFPLQPFQKFLIAFIFLEYIGKQKVVFNRFFWTMGRGAGKNGLASGLANYFISPMYGVKSYNVGIVATSEEQAMTSVDEVYDAIDEHKQLQNHFNHGKAKITGKKTKSWFKYYTSNARTKDGARLGAIFFDEIHEYENNKVINVFQSGFGKRAYSRRFYIGTDGYVRDGVYDKTMERAMDWLKGKGQEDEAFFPFVCRLDDITELDDFNMWQKANPMLHPPMSEYAEILYDEMISDYHDLKYGGDKIEFIVKRMNFSAVNSQMTVAAKEEIMACNRPFPNLKGAQGVGGLDLASKKDFIACGVLMKTNDTWNWFSHSFVLKSFLDNYEIQAPIEEWSRATDDRPPLLTIVDDVEVDLNLIVDWFISVREHFDFDTIVIDNYRSLSIKKPLEAAGFNVIVIYKSKAYQAGIGLNIQTLFARKQLVWGINPLMNWYTYNVKVERDSFDNIVYGKIEKFRRKTDGFMAFTHAYWHASQTIEDVETDFFLEDFWD
ncbi:terminase TerL endonuclease subunit [Globicatella sanguinis]